jgi:23S rRNA pseudouridine1911/1915/1917 synthase
VSSSECDGERQAKGGEKGEGNGERSELVVEVPAALEGQRVDRAVSIVTGLSRRVVAEQISQGRVTIDGSMPASRSRALAAGEVLRIELAVEDQRLEPDPSVGFEVVHEDRTLVVVDKPAGVVVHRGAGNETGTLVSGLLARYPDLALLASNGIGEPDRPGIVHRLDKGTSGLLVVARTPEAYHSLSGQFRRHTARREYVALLAGRVEDDRGIVDGPIGRSARHPERMAIIRSGRPASTEYSVLSRYSEPVALTLVRARLTTGRTHQVRVHLAAIGHPVIGDDRYGEGAKKGTLQGALEPGRLFLHAARLEIDHPQHGRTAFESLLPADLRLVLETVS